ncbi:hypothetical protein PHLGIDRAFT_303022 [Phlebiopsis gigantea 11061_1 CR5-6]|uniref:Uncharacterized protein n=1 Tax=Phlebiopsis gigantea (strain 11061_1 CR5-6) TaxID=745531 RepID=A0A0C3SB68_PHLG1|nr:hypothetical protein PHLGIDRAFT_303022 [Phlebiopsis gigantea 11061_1 CR5-6]
MHRKATETMWICGKRAGRKPRTRGRRKRDGSADIIRNQRENDRVQGETHAREPGKSEGAKDRNGWERDRSMIGQGRTHTRDLREALAATACCWCEQSAFPKSRFVVGGWVEREGRTRGGSGWVGASGWS